jgi:hypothetical protein
MPVSKRRAKLGGRLSTGRISKTEAIEPAHAAYVAYRQLKFVPERPTRPGKRSSGTTRTAIRAKHSA